MRGLHTMPPSSSPPPLIPGTPNPPPHSNTTPTSSNAPSTSLSSFQASVDYLHAKNTELHNNIESFQSQMQSQFSSFQQNVLDAILRLQPPSSTSTSLPSLLNPSTRCPLVLSNLSLLHGLDSAFPILHLHSSIPLPSPALPSLLHHTAVLPTAPPFSQIQHVNGSKSYEAIC